MPIVITSYELPQDRLDQFEAPVFNDHHRFRALQDDAKFAYIDVAEVTADPADAVQAARDSGYTAHSGCYDVFHSGGDAVEARSAPIVFINCFQVELGNEDAAFERWSRINNYMVTKPGYLAHRLHRRTHDDAAFGFVNVVHWASTDAWAAAHDDRFRTLVAAPLPFVSMATLCREVDLPAVRR
jgi:heme-degrading monooxygenase HmoA